MSKLGGLDPVSRSTFHIGDSYFGLFERVSVLRFLPVAPHKARPVSNKLL